MNNGLQLPECPYCEKALGFFETKNIHKRGEYVCPNCGCVSKITYQSKIKVTAVVVVILALLIAIVSVLMGNVNIWQVILTILPFAVFYVLVPYTMVLKVKDQNESEDYFKSEYEEDIKYDDMKVYSEKKKRRRYSSMNLDVDMMAYDDIEKTRVF